MAIIRSLVVKIKGDSSSIEKSLNKTARSIKKTGRDISSVGNSMITGVTLPLLAAGAAAYKLSSDYEEAMNKVSVVFAEHSKEVETWSKGTLKKFGLASGTALDMASDYGDMATSMGFATGSASKLARSIVGLSADVASFKNKSIKQVQTAMTGIFTGETESLKGLGVIMTKANLDAFALAQGLKKTTDEMTQGEKVALRYQYVFESLSNAQGDFERTSGGAANQMRVFMESVKQLGQSFSNVLLPMITPVITKINEFVIALGSMNDEQKTAIVYIAGIGVAAGPVAKIIGGLTTGVGFLVAKLGAVSVAVKGGSGLLGVFKALIGTGGLVVASVAGIAVVAYGTSLAFTEFRKSLDDDWERIKVTAQGAGAAFEVVVAGIKYGITKIDNQIKTELVGSLQTMYEKLSKVPYIGEQYKETAESLSAMVTGYGFNTSSAWLELESAKQKFKSIQEESAAITKKSTSSMYQFFDAVGEKLTEKYESFKSFFSLSSESLDIDMDAYSDLASLETLLEDLANAAGRVATETESMETVFDRMNSSVREMVTSIREQTRSFAEFVGLFDTAEKKFVSGDSLLRKLKGQLMSMQQWEQNLLVMQQKGMSNSMLNVLRNMGPGYAGEIAGLSKLSSEKLAEYEALYSQKYAIAGNQASMSVGHSKSAETIIENQIILEIADNYIMGNRDIDDITDRIIDRLKALGIKP